MYDGSKVTKNDFSLHYLLHQLNRDLLEVTRTHAARNVCCTLSKSPSRLMASWQAAHQRIVFSTTCISIETDFLCNLNRRRRDGKSHRKRIRFHLNIGNIKIHAHQVNSGVGERGHTPNFRPG